MYFPAQLAPNKILGRFPVTPSTVIHLKGITESGIMVTGFGDTDVSPSKKQRQFYLDILTDKDGQLQAKVPAVLEIIMLPEKYDNEEILKLKVGDYWAVDAIAGTDFGIDVEINESAEEVYYWYILFGNSRNLVWRVEDSDLEDIMSNYQAEDIFLQDANEVLSEEVRKASQEYGGQGGQMPTAKLKSPILDIGNKIHTM